MDMPWHDYSSLMVPVLTKGDLAGFEKLRLAAFSKPNVKRHDGMAYEANRDGHAFTAFGATDMMERLCEAALLAGSEQYLDMAEECGRPALIRWKKGGLLSDEGDWLHARTSETEKTKGATFNKALIAIISMASAAKLFEKAGRVATAKALRDQAIASTLQLADKNAWPNWESFIATKGKKCKPVPRSWLAYGLNWDKREIYFLDDEPVKNGMYAIKCMECLGAIAGRLQLDMTPFKNFEIGDSGLSICGWFLQTVKLKQADGWYVDSKTGGNGNFGALSHVRNPEPVIVGWLQTFLTKWA